MTSDNTTSGGAENQPTNPIQSTEQLSVTVHPHHSLVSGAMVATGALIRQLEAHVAEECHDAIEHLRSAVSKMKNKLDLAYKQPE